MQMIKMFVDFIEDELEGAEEYIEHALKMKMDHKDVADKLAALAEVEMSHAMALHEMAVKEIEAWRKEHGEPPANMLARWEYEHEKFIEEANEIKRDIMLYKSNM